MPTGSASVSDSDRHECRRSSLLCVKQWLVTELVEFRHDLFSEEAHAGLRFVKRHAAELERIDAGAALRLFVKVIPVHAGNEAAIA